MKFICGLIVVNDIKVSRNFYETVLEQEVQYDFGDNVIFSGGFAIHQKTHFAELLNLNPDDIIPKSNTGELYFEENDLEGLLERLNNLDSLEYIHGIKVQPWGQRVIRFYDPDQHIIEVGESMENVARRMLQVGFSVEETARHTSMPEEFVKKCL